MGRTRDVSKILTSNTSILSLASASSIYQTIAKTGLIEITPATISVTGGSGSISATGAVSFTSASTISLNDVFNTTYDNYKILMNFTSSAQAAINMRLRVSGSDNSTSNYHNHWQQTSTSETAYTGANEVSQTSFRVSSSSGTTSIKSLSFDFFAPFLSDRTMYLGLQNFSNANKGNGYAGGVQQGAFNDSTSFTGFTLISNSGTLTGTISIYGYNK
jgi:hypothetical protein